MNRGEVAGIEMNHERMGYPSSLYRVTNSIFLDPYDELTPEQNKGVWLNHGRFEPNCRVVPVMSGDNYIALRVMAIKDIARGEELLQDYGREGGQGPIFLFK